MSKIAAAFVLLPDDKMMDRTIKMNNELVLHYGSEVHLNKLTCVPHITLAMAVMEEEDRETISNILKNIGESMQILHLQATAIVHAKNNGQFSIVLEVEKTQKLQSLHLKILQQLSPYFTYDVTPEMFYSPPKVDDVSYYWSKKYPQTKIYNNYEPHLTIGQSNSKTPSLKKMSFPYHFTADKLALFHLGKQSTCRKIIYSYKLKK